MSFPLGVRVGFRAVNIAAGGSQSYSHCHRMSHAPCYELLGWHYLSNSTCLMRPRAFHALFAASRITILVYMCSPRLKKPCVRQVVSDKWFPLSHGLYCRGICSCACGAPLQRFLFLEYSNSRNRDPKNEHQHRCCIISGVRVSLSLYVTCSVT